MKNQVNTELKSNVEKLAASEGKSPLDIITMLQSAAATNNDEKTLDALCALKWEYI